MIAILLLNAMGYYGIFMGMQYRNERMMNSSLDADAYDQANAITLKIPVTIPYIPDQTDFSRATGKFEHEGQLYRIVKQRYSQDTVTIICVKDIEHEKINTLLTAYVKTFTDNATDDPSHIKILISLITYYLSEPFFIRSMTNGWSTQIMLNTTKRILIPSFTASIIHPPERI